MNKQLHTSPQHIVLRAVTDADLPQVRRLAELEGIPSPSGMHMLGADGGDGLLAVIDLADGTVVADPFRRSTAAVELLRLRAAQLAGAPARSGGRLRRVLDGLRRGHAYAGLAGSPPGAGGRLLQL
jgi:hypothetical protein